MRATIHDAIVGASAGFLSTIAGAHADAGTDAGTGAEGPWAMRSIGFTGWH